MEKKRKNNKKNKQIKKIVTIEIVASLIIIAIFSLSIFLRKKLDNNFQKTAINNQNIINNSTQNNNQTSASNDFKIEKIITFSSSFGENQNKDFQVDSWVLDINQYTDIGVYLSNPNNIIIKQLWINNLEYTIAPKLGTPTCYYTDALKFGTDTVLKEYEFNNTIEFNVINSDNQNNLINYESPTFFADCSTPICIKYLNSIMKNFTLKNTTQITQDGRLLNNIINDTKVLNAEISFNINIIDNEGNKYTNNVVVTIPTDNLLTEGKITKINDYK